MGFRPLRIFSLSRMGQDCDTIFGVSLIKPSYSLHLETSEIALALMV